MRMDKEDGVVVMVGVGKGRGGGRKEGRGGGMRWEKRLADVSD